MGSRQCLPSTPTHPPAHLPEVHASHTFKGPHLPELLPTEGMPAFFQGDCPLIYPSPLTCQCDPHPHLLPCPLPYSPPLLAVQAFSLPKLSCSRGVVGGVGVAWPLRGMGKGDMGVGYLGAALRKGSEASGERGRGRGRQPASRLYIPAVLIYHVTAPVDSQPRKRGREGRGGLGEGSGTPIVLGPSGASLAGCGAMLQPAHPPRKKPTLSCPHPLLAAALSLKASLVEEFKHRSPHFFRALAALHLLWAQHLGWGWRDRRGCSKLLTAWAPLFPPQLGWAGGRL